MGCPHVVLPVHGSHKQKLPIYSESSLPDKTIVMLTSVLLVSKCISKLILYNDISGSVTSLQQETGRDLYHEYRIVALFGARTRN